MKIDNMRDNYILKLCHAGYVDVFIIKLLKQIEKAAYFPIYTRNNVIKICIGSN